MVAPVEVGVGGIELLVANGLLKQHETRDRELIGAACLEALEQWTASNQASGACEGQAEGILLQRQSLICMFALGHQSPNKKRPAVISLRGVHFSDTRIIVPHFAG